MNEAERQARANISPEVLREMERVCPTSMMRDIAMRDNRAPTGPSSQGIIPTTQPFSNVRGPTVGSGWAHEIPLRNGLGQGKWTENDAFVPERKAKGG
jgi:hypothetical protein